MVTCGAVAVVVGGSILPIIGGRVDGVRWSRRWILCNRQPGGICASAPFHTGADKAH